MDIAELIQALTAAGLSPSNMILAFVICIQQHRLWKVQALLDKIVKKHIGVNGND